MIALPGQVEGLSLQLQQAIALLESLADRQQATENRLAQDDPRTREDRLDPLPTARAAVTPEDAHGWCRDAGHTSLAHAH